jgi:hypothetical protein
MWFVLWIYKLISNGCFENAKKNQKTNKQESGAGHDRSCDTNCRLTDKHMPNVGSNRSKYNFSICNGFFSRKKKNKKAKPVMVDHVTPTVDRLTNIYHMSVQIA